MQGWSLTFGAAAALLIFGVLLGRTWALSRHRRRDGSRYGDHPHYLLGLNYLISNQPDLALAELTKAVKGETDAIEAYLALGNLFREKGQVERAIDIHKSLLHRPNLTDLGRTQALFSLALDFQDRGAHRSFRAHAARSREARPFQPERLALFCAACTRRWDAGSGRRRFRDASTSWPARATTACSPRCGPSGAGRRCTTVTPRPRRPTTIRLSRSSPTMHRRTSARGNCLARSDDLRGAMEHWEAALHDGSAWAIGALERILAAATEADGLGQARTRLVHGARAPTALLARVPDLGPTAPASRRARCGARGFGSRANREARLDYGAARDAGASRQPGGRRGRAATALRSGRQRGPSGRPVRLPRVRLQGHRALHALSALPRLEHRGRRADLVCCLQHSLTLALPAG